MEDYDVRSAASILASVKEQEARFEQLTRALEEERRNVTLQLERANLPSNPPTSQPLAWQQVVIQYRGRHRGTGIFTQGWACAYSSCRDEQGERLLKGEVVGKPFVLQAIYIPLGRLKPSSFKSAFNIGGLNARPGAPPCYLITIH
ncbi:hypothetical protein Q8A73_012208 [Channa argus]|nr:hypothetical protein Q8A73_012208 [Channa argus]